MNKTDKALKLAKECGATTYTNRHYPDATAVTFSPLAWEKFCKQAFAAPTVQVLQRYSPDGEGGMEVDSLGVYVKHQDVSNPPAAPAPVQEPVAHCEAGPAYCQQCHLEDRSLALAAAVRYVKNNTPKLVSDEICKALSTPPAQPAVPDAITDIGEDPKYRAGWNECRETMLQILKARTL